MISSTTAPPKMYIFGDNVLIYKLMKKGKSYDGGKKIQANLEIGKHAGAYGPRTEFPVAKKEILTAAFFEYAAYFGTSTYDMEDDLLNNGEAAIINIIQTKLKNMQKSIRDDMAIDIWRTRAANIAAAEYDDPRPFAGVGDLFDQTASTKYGEIAPEDLLKEDGTTSMWKTGAIASWSGLQGSAGNPAPPSLGQPMPSVYHRSAESSFEASEYALTRHSG